MKTPEEIKKGLEYCSISGDYCGGGDCPYAHSPVYCDRILMQRDALVYIQQLEERNSKLEYTLLGVMHSVDKWLDVEPYDFDNDDGTVAATRASNAREIALKAIEKAQADLAQVEREKDAAVAEIKRMEAKTEELRDMVNDVIHRELPYSDYLDFINQVDQICNYQFENEWRGGCKENAKEKA